MNYALMILWIISMVILLLLPYSIALFYQRIFKRNTYPYLFLMALALYIFSSFQYSFGNLPFALGGVILGAASFRLYNVMTRRGK
jgi:hypothetical protein